MTSLSNKSQSSIQSELNYSASSASGNSKVSRKHNQSQSYYVSSNSSSDGNNSNRILNNCVYHDREHITTATEPINNQHHSIKSYEFIPTKEASDDSEINKIATIPFFARHSTASDIVVRDNALNLFVALQKKRGVPEEEISKIVSELR